MRYAHRHMHAHLPCEYCKNHSELEDQYKADVYDKGSEVDPESEMHWGHLIVGYALGKGLSPEKAREFASHIRYHTEIG